MEEKKPFTQQNGQNGEGGRKKKRHRHHGNHGGNNNGGNNANAQTAEKQQNLVIQLIIITTCLKPNLYTQNYIENGKRK